MPPQVLDAMADAARSFVELDELQRLAGERLAELTRNEAACVSSGAAAGLVLATAACVAGGDPAAIARLPDVEGLKDEVIVHRTHRNGYDHAVRQVGVRLVEIGCAEGTSLADLEAAFSARTAAVFWFQGAMCTPGDLPLRDVIGAAHARGVPVVVDAAAQLPPVENLWRFTRELGADLAVFSGGKDLRGPQCSGLVVGRRDLVRACVLNGNPNHSIGRPMKVGKEEIAGLVAAVDRYVHLDHAAREAWCEDVVAHWNESLCRLPGITAVRDFPNEAGQPLPWTLVTVDPSAPVGRDEIVRRLDEGEPCVKVAPWRSSGIHLNPMTLEPGEEGVVLARIIEAASGSA